MSRVNIRAFRSSVTLFGCVLGGVIASVQAQQVDPLPTFKAIVSACDAHANTLPRERVRQLKSGEWAFLQATPVRVSYDVKRTDSLISPFTAFIKLELQEVSIRGKTEDEARSAPPSSATHFQFFYELRYAHQEGAWKLTGGSNDAKIKGAADSGFRSPMGPIQLTPEDMTKTPLLKGCLT